MDVVRDGFVSCVDLYLSKPGLPLDGLGNEFLIHIVNDVTNLELLVVWFSS